MAFDVIVSDRHDQAIEIIHLFVEDQSFIMDQDDFANSCPLMFRGIKDYYGEGEIYINELKDLQLEIGNLKHRVKKSAPPSVLVFLDELMGLAGKAFELKTTLKFVGD